eukprot:scaffold6292_cov50-Prasinocladus_malaysianus.AAC.1
MHSIFHASGVLKDAMLPSQTIGNLRQVLAPKTNQLKSMGVHACRSGIMCMTLFSSVSVFLGATAQFNYVAANAMLDWWAKEWKGFGLDVSSMQWGAWCGVGMAVNTTNVLARATSAGIGVVKPLQGLMALRVIGACSVSHNAPVLLATPLDIAQLHYIGARHRILDDIMLDILVNAKDDNTLSPSCANSLCLEPQEPQRLEALKDNLQRTKFSQLALQEKLQDIIRENVGLQLSPSELFMNAGIDSLAVVELKDAIALALDIQLPPTVMFDHPSIEALSYHLCQLQSVEAVVVPDLMATSKPDGDFAHEVAQSISVETIRSHITDVIASSIGEIANPNQPFAELGVDSLGAVELRSTIVLSLGVELSPTALFDHPTIEALTSHVHSKLNHSNTNQQKKKQRMVRDSKVIIENFSTRKTIHATLLAHVPEPHSGDGACARSIPFDRWDVESSAMPSLGTRVPRMG